MKTFAFILALAMSLAAQADDLARYFQHPPASARPWVYWFWNNANVTSNGITVDLEAMQRVGIGGAILVNVDTGKVVVASERFAPPRGTAEFMNHEWRDLFQFSLQEAARLGLEIDMANGPGWCGSSGPWITPELSMQKLVSTNTFVEGPAKFSDLLPKPDISNKQDNKHWDFYRDIAVIAFPETTNGVVSRAAVMDLSAKLHTNGKLTWDVPPGRWIIQRIGCTTTGSSTRPAVVGGGLECDKLSAEAMDAHFANMMERLIARAGPLAGKSLVATHIDSWEVGSQNWTPKFREEFKKRRGYDPLPWLPCVTESVLEKSKTSTTTRYLHNFDGIEMAERFRWDFYQTIAELFAENYSGQIAKLAHQHGLRLTLEGYTLPFGDQFTYTARADEPMTEFWTGNAFNPARRDTQTIGAASVAHVYGRAIVGGEAFTSGNGEMWKLTPADVKPLGDFEFSQGVNRFVFHRYAHQPYLDRWPGVAMGPWGMHYERTETWWEMSKPWHEYLSRCQFMLRRGKFVADLCYLRPEIPNQTYFDPDPPLPKGYRYDEISAEAIMKRMSVQDGRLVLPDGMNYRVLVLPQQAAMTPALAEKIKSLVAAGATVVGPRPETSPSLQDYPKCDGTVARIGNEVWGDCDGKKSMEHRFGCGKVVCGQPLATVLAGLQAPPDFQSDADLNWIHLTAGDAEIYFVANPSQKFVTANCQFRAAGHPEIWNPETGKEFSATLDSSGGARALLTLPLGPSDAVFVVFRNNASQLPPFTKDEPRSLAEVPGPWKIDFPAGWGAPASISLTNLVSWTDYPEDGVKYFSGTATYQTKFNFTNSPIADAVSKIYLELGGVKVMARAKVNGRDCGVAWRPPFRVDITGALKSGENQLEIQVANLWPNRMIGDAALPPTNRFTWSSWEPFTKGMPLLKSGLLGPVTLSQVSANRSSHYK